MILAIGQRPDPREVAAGLWSVGPGSGYLGLVVALVGASLMPWMLFYQQAATVEKGLGRDDLPAARRETLAGATVSQLLMVAIVAAAAGATAGVGSTIAPAIETDLPAGLARLASGPSVILVAVGLIGAGLLALIVISLSAAWAWAELFDWPHSLDLAVKRAPGFYGIYLLEIVPAALVVLIAPNLGALVLGAMILNVVVLIVPLAFLVRLSSDRRLLGALANSRRRAAILWTVAGALLLFGLAGLVSEALGLGR